MNADAEICLCFHVTRRKLTSYARRHSLRVASQLSECGGAGTGCGWCVPFLRQLFLQVATGAALEWEDLAPDEYARLRRQYIRAGNGTPPTADESR